MTDLINTLIAAAVANPIPLALFLLLQAADVISTLRFLKVGVREGNGIIARLMDRLGCGWIVVKLLVALIATGLILYSGIAWPLWTLNAVYAAAVFWNWRQGSR